MSDEEAVQVLLDQCVDIPDEIAQELWPMLNEDDLNRLADALYAQEKF